MGDKLGVITVLPQSQIITTAAFAWQSAEGNDRDEVAALRWKPDDLWRQKLLRVFGTFLIDQQLVLLVKNECIIAQMHCILKPVFDVLFELCAFALDLSATVTVIQHHEQNKDDKQGSNDTYNEQH